MPRPTVPRLTLAAAFRPFDAENNSALSGERMNHAAPTVPLSVPLIFDFPMRG